MSAVFPAEAGGLVGQRVRLSLVESKTTTMEGILVSASRDRVQIRDETGSVGDVTPVAGLLIESLQEVQR